MNKTQTGFALIEGLLIILILAIIGFGGYYVWNTQKNVDKTSKETVNTSQSAATTSSSDKLFVIKEWGIKGPNSASVHLKYKIGDFAGHPAAEFTSEELLAAGGSDCASGGGVITQYSSSDKNELNVTNPDQTIEQGAISGDIAYYSLVGNKYYVFHGPQAGCGDPDKIQTLETDTLGAVKALSQGLRSI